VRGMRLAGGCLVSGGDVLRGVRPGMGCPLGVPQWTVGGLPGQPGGLGPWSGGDVVAGPPCVRVASIAGRPPAPGGSGVP